MDTDPSPAPCAPVHPTKPSQVADPSRCMLGKAPRTEHAHTLRAESFIGDIPAPPPEARWTDCLGADALPLFGNDVHSNCGPCAAAHLVECWSANVGKEAPVAQPDVDAFYSLVAGWAPTDPSTDNGVILTELLAKWRDVGIGGHKIRGWCELVSRRVDVLKLAIAEFGGVLMGFDLPLCVKGLSSWGTNVTGGNDTPGSWGGHAVGGLAFHANEEGFWIATWGGLLFVEWAFYAKYCDECYGPLSDDFFAGDTAPNGFDRQAMLAAMTAIQAVTA